MLESKGMARLVHQRIAKRDMVRGRISEKRRIGGVDQDVAYLWQECLRQRAARTVNVGATDANVAANAERPPGRTSQCQIDVVWLIDEVDAAQLIPANERVREQVKPGAAASDRCRPGRLPKVASNVEIRLLDVPFVGAYEFETEVPSGTRLQVSVIGVP